MFCLDACYIWKSTSFMILFISDVDGSFLSHPGVSFFAFLIFHLGIISMWVFSSGIEFKFEFSYYCASSVLSSIPIVFESFSKNSLLLDSMLFMTSYICFSVSISSGSIPSSCASYVIWITESPISSIFGLIKDFESETCWNSNPSGSSYGSFL